MFLAFIWLKISVQCNADSVRDAISLPIGAKVTLITTGVSRAAPPHVVILERSEESRGTAKAESAMFAQTRGSFREGAVAVGD